MKKFLAAVVVSLALMAPAAANHDPSTECVTEERVNVLVKDLGPSVKLVKEFRGADAQALMTKLEGPPADLIRIYHDSADNTYLIVVYNAGCVVGARWFPIDPSAQP